MSYYDVVDDARTVAYRGVRLTREPLDGDTLGQAVESARESMRCWHRLPGRYEFTVQDRDGNEVHRETFVVEGGPR